MTKLDRLVFNSFQVNTYIIHDESGECVIIDPSCFSEEENETLVAFISQHNLKPVLHLNTHCHIDHVLGMQFIRDKYMLETYVHREELKALHNAPLMGDLFGWKVEALPSPENLINDNDIIRFGETELIALHVPGHSAGSIAFYNEGSAKVITGDALFAGSIGRTDLPGGDYDTLISSIREKLFSLPPETMIYPGHGESSTIGHELENNPFF
jgi:glyoxylase-like metal-dependent hydrolase (beta-lactamase superfamily II)